MTASIREARARAEAEAAKARLIATIDELKVRLAPTTLASQAIQAAKDKSIVVADNAVSAVKEKPVMAAGIAAGTAMFLARGPIWSVVSDLLSNRKHRKGATARQKEDQNNGK